MQKGARGTAPLGITDRRLHVRDALQVSIVQIIALRKTQAFHGLHEYIGCLRLVYWIGYLERPRRAMTVIVQALISLLPAKIRQQCVPSPIESAGRFGPSSIVEARTSRVCHGVDGTAATDHIALGNRYGATVQMRLGRGFVPFDIGASTEDHGK